MKDETLFRRTEGRGYAEDDATAQQKWARKWDSSTSVNPELFYTTLGENYDTQKTQSFAWVQGENRVPAPPESITGISRSFSLIVCPYYFVILGR